MASCKRSFAHRLVGNGAMQIARLARRLPYRTSTGADKLTSHLDRHRPFCQLLVVCDESDDCRRRSCIDRELRDFQRRHSYFVAVSIALRRTGAEIRGISGVIADRQRSGRQLRNIVAGTCHERMNGRGNIRHDPLPETRSRWGIDVVHRDDEALRSGWFARPADLRRHVVAMTAETV